MNPGPSSFKPLASSVLATVTAPRLFPAGWLALLVASGFCLFHWAMGGLNSIHLIYAGMFGFLYFLHPQSRTFFLLASPICLHNVLYDAFRYIPFAWLQPIHIQDIYEWDARLFGIHGTDGVMLLHHYFLTFSHPILDALAGIAYHLLDPMVFIILFLCWKLVSKDLAERYSTGFLLMNLFALATYFFFPAAAPWYVANHGFIQPADAIMGNPAGLANFDTLFGLNLSQDVYSLNPVVFGAVPSMHAGFTMLGWLYSRFLGRAWFFGYGIFAFTMWGSALYLQHHYFLDVVLGILYAVVAYFLTETILRRWVQISFGRIFSMFGPAQGWLIFGRKKHPPVDLQVQE